MSTTGESGVGLKPLGGQGVQTKAAEEVKPESLTDILQGFEQSEGKQQHSQSSQDPEALAPPKTTKPGTVPPRESFVASAGNTDLAKTVMALRNVTLKATPAASTAAPATPAAKSPTWNLVGNGVQRALGNLQRKSNDRMERAREFFSERICGKPYETRKEKQVRQLTEVAIQNQMVQTSQQQTQQQQARFEVQRTQEVDRIKDDDSSMQRAREQELQRRQKLQELRTATSTVSQPQVNTVSSAAASGVKTTTSLVEQKVSQYNQAGALLSTAATQTRDSVTQDDPAARAPGLGPDGRPRDKR